MSILIIRRSESPPAGAARIAPDAIPGPVVAQLLARAADAGRALSIRDCRDDGQVATALERASAQGADFVLLDPGSAPQCDARYRAALARLRVPYVEVHDDRAEREPDLGLGPAAPRAAACVHGYAAQGYVMALDIALERLGCDERGYRYHVGT